MFTSSPIAASAAERRPPFFRYSRVSTKAKILTRFLYSSSSSDRWLTSASYFALRNVSFGYTLPKNLTKKASIENCRVYVTGDNLWLKSARKGLDPRQDVGGGTGYGYSAMRTYSLGLSLTF